MYLDMINVVPIAGAYPCGGPFGACAPPPMSLMPNEKAYGKTTYWILPMN